MEDNNKLRALKLSTIAISSVVLIELCLGLAVRSLAILSDGLHALFDALTTFVLLITTRASLKPPDEEHMYGHEKLESVGGLVGGVALIGLAISILFESILRLMENRPYIVSELQFAGFFAIGYTLCIDLIRVATLRSSGIGESFTTRAGLYHAIADLGSTLIALLGFGLGTLGFLHGDAFSSVILSILLAFLSVRLVWSTGMELSDSISKDMVRKIENEISSVGGVYRYERLRVRKSGEKVFIRGTLKVPDYVGLEEAHEISAKIESKIKGAVKNADIALHIEPTEMGEMPIEGLIERLIAAVDGVKEAHDVNTAYVDGKLYVTLHAQVDPEMSIEESHEIAERIERAVTENVRGVENVTVHMEPYTSELKRGRAIDESEVRQIVEKVAENYRQDLKIKRIVTYVAGDRRHINIDCIFSGRISIDNAHEIASRSEDLIRQRFAETVVTVHMEPNPSEITG